ncbi:hypothetical protein KPH14_003657 [Odynerus spinipes]|uniref:Reverse transcriptase Ty1/copia-type domain-containing protein n=1 Tax=Odynerus spinipes TaxID=1348599 RepID=A0AAD9RGI9_9HYME|nr:hypothetical protein KPH14_003657 [Odynerus spinipes]
MRVIGSDDEVIDEVMEKLKEQFEMVEKKTEKLKFLNIRIKIKQDGIELSQAEYVDRILENFGLKECNPAKTPLDSQTDLNESKNSEPANKLEYQSMLGSLMYLSTATRPDISYAVSKLSQFSNDPRKIHVTAAKRVFRYLKGTSDYSLKYSRESEDLRISTDASWNSEKGARSYSGYDVRLGQAVIGWKSRKQELVALSTCEAEIIAICEGVRELKWISGLLNSLGMEEYTKPPIVINSDSTSAINWIQRNNITNRTKHIERKYYFVRDELKKGSIRLSHVSSEDMEADFVTKSLNTIKHGRNVELLGLVDVNYIST